MAKQQTRRRTRQEAPRRGRKKICIFCAQKIAWVDYKDVNVLRRFMSDRGKIRARRVSGNCTQHQREVAVAIKTARELALLPYTQRTVSERTGGRRGGGGGGRDRDRDRDRPRDSDRAEVVAEASVDIDVDDVAGAGDEATTAPIEIGEDET